MSAITVDVSVTQIVPGMLLDIKGLVARVIDMKRASKLGNERYEIIVITTTRGTYWSDTNHKLPVMMTPYQLPKEADEMVEEIDRASIAP